MATRHKVQLGERLGAENGGLEKAVRSGV